MILPTDILIPDSANRQGELQEKLAQQKRVVNIYWQGADKGEARIKGLGVTSYGLKI